MHIQLLLLFILLLLLFLISRKIINLIYTFFLFVFRSRKFAIGILSVILLPGTFIHELSHLLMATLLRVQVGKLSVCPKIEDSEEVLIGHMEVGKADPFRLTLVGIAPMITGLSIIYLIGKIFMQNIPLTIPYTLNPIRLLGFYLLLVTCQTMFSSRKDLKSLIIVGPVIIIIAASLYFAGIRLFFNEALNTTLLTVLNNLNLYLLLANLANLSVLILFGLIIYIGNKITVIR